jgi:hypothetical protein
MGLLVVANLFWRKNVGKTKARYERVRNIRIVGAAMVLTGVLSGEPYVRAGGWAIARMQDSQEKTTKTENGSMTTQSKFYCNIKALNPAERAHHMQLTDKLLAARKETVETAKGYEFQFSPASVSLAELSDWVAAESKCCPFFDFHIDLENEGSLLCLRLTGEEGIKPFIREEFRFKPAGGAS